MEQCRVCLAFCLEMVLDPNFSRVWGCLDLGWFGLGLSLAKIEFPGSLAESSSSLCFGLSAKPWFCSVLCIIVDGFVVALGESLAV